MPTTVIDDTNKDEAVEVKGQAPTLDEVHARNQAKVEAEDAANENTADNEDDADSQGSDAGDAGTDDDADADAATGDDDAGTVTVETTPPVTVAPDKPAVELDIEKNGPGKVAIKDSLGKTWYFNNTDEVPDDFEPASYKALMVGNKALWQKEQSDAKQAADEKEKEAFDARAAESKRLVDNWTTESEQLASTGLLPKDAAKRQAVENEVYEYMESEMKKGNIISSFTQAFKALAFDKQQEADNKRQKEINDAKKKRGSIVQGGSGADKVTTTGRGGGRMIEAPPSGASLDAVHQRAISQL